MGICVSKIYYAYENNPVTQVSTQFSLKNLTVEKEPTDWDYLMKYHSELRNCLMKMRKCC